MVGFFYIVDDLTGDSRLYYDAGARILFYIRSHLPPEHFPNEVKVKPGCFIR